MSKRWYIVHAFSNFENKVAQSLRERFHVPVVFLTAFAADEFLARAKLSQPYGYLLKPFYERELKSALEMANAVRGLNEEHRAKGMPEIGIGIGCNTGNMCVGDMGSNIRQSYTVIGDAVNLGSRLEGLSKVYGVDIVVSESTRKLAPELDRKSVV